LIFAEEEAHRLGYDHVGTGHLLLGLLREGGGGARVLRRLGLRLAPARQLVGTFVGRDEIPARGALPLQPRTRQVLALALEEAARPSRSPVEPEHLLLGLLREGEGIGVDVIERLGVDPGQVRRALARLTTSGDGRTRLP